MAASPAVSVIRLLVIDGRSPRISRNVRLSLATSVTDVAHILLNATQIGQRLEGTIPMSRTEDRRFIYIETSGDGLEITQSEYEPSLEEWHHRRTNAFARLRKDGFIPEELLDLVEKFKEQTIVRLFGYRPAEKLELRLGIKVAEGQADRGKARRFAAAMAAPERKQDDEEKAGMTASETLAFFLRICLRDLKHAEKNRDAAPVRTLNLVPRSLIAEIAMDLLESCETWGQPPGRFLNSLMHELLNLEHDRQGMPREGDTKEQAAYFVAQAPNVPTRELARELHVNASTISRWRRSPVFEQMVERKRKSLEKLAGLSESIGSLEQGKPIQDEHALFPKPE
jgi:hypothetical protein